MITKVQENRLRRAAKRQGYTLVKSRVRNPEDEAYGKYQLEGWIPVRAGGLDAASVAMLLQEPLEAPSKPQYVPHRYRKETPS